MQAHIRILSDRYGSGKDLAEWTCRNFRAQSTGGGNGPKGYIVGDRLHDAEGVPATDFEHDNAWALRLEIYGGQVEMITGDWFEIIGVADEVMAWTPEELAANKPWENGRVCTSCASFEGHREHAMVEHYVPPRQKPFQGKWVKVTIAEKITSNEGGDDE